MITHGTFLGWQGGLDWEVYRTPKGYRAELFDEDVLLAAVEARWPLVLRVKMAVAQRKVTRTY